VIRIPRYLIACLLLLAVFADTVFSDSEIVYNPNNDHYYQRIDTPMTWVNSITYCETLGGYLATVTSESENQFITGLVSTDTYLAGNDEAIEGEWVWITGEPWVYENFGPGEPNNQWGLEHHLLTGPGGLWNDGDKYNDDPRPFICEWGCLFGIDSDNDQLNDCADNCPNHPNGPEGGVDEDCDGATDCIDTHCIGDPACEGSELVSFWQLDGNATDSSNYGNHGTVNGATPILNGTCESAFSFDGVDDYINCGNPTNGSLDFGENIDFTISVWVKTTMSPSSNWPTIIAKQTFPPEPRIGYAMVMVPDGGGKVSFGILTGPITACAVDSTTVINDNEWHYLVGLRRGNSVEFYIDGELEGSTICSAADDLSNNVPLEIGANIANPYPTAISFNGTIDEIRIYKKALLENEIRVDMCECAPEGMDPDADNISSFCDNCPEIANPGQDDTFPPGRNGIGDACDCECDFNCDGNVDATDVDSFLTDFGRSPFNNPCTNADPCNGDVDCDVNVDADDVTMFLQDFGRSQFNNPCPECVAGAWCAYP